MRLLAQTLYLQDEMGERRKTLSIISFNTEGFSDLSILYMALCSGKEIGITDLVVSKFHEEAHSLLLAESPLVVTKIHSGYILKML